MFHPQVFLFRFYKGDCKALFFTESKVKNMLSYTRNKPKDYLIKEGVEI